MGVGMRMGMTYMGMEGTGKAKGIHAQC